MRQLHYPHLVEMYDIKETKKFLFIVMEYMEGGELFEEIVKNKFLDEQKAFSFFI